MAPQHPNNKSPSRTDKLKNENKRQNEEKTPADKNKKAHTVNKSTSDT